MPSCRLLEHCLPRVPHMMPTLITVPPVGGAIVSSCTDLPAGPAVGSSSKFAPHVRSAIRVVRPLGAQSPVNPVKRKPLSGTTSSSTVFPFGTSTEQSEPPVPQFKPPPVMVPPPGFAMARRNVSELPPVRLRAITIPAIVRRISSATPPAINHVVRPWRCQNDCCCTARCDECARVATIVASSAAPPGDAPRVLSIVAASSSLASNIRGSERLDDCLGCASSVGGSGVIDRCGGGGVQLPFGSSSASSASAPACDGSSATASITNRLAASNARSFCATSAC